ncbi:MAG: hypothetical protein PGN19_08970 [Pseudomonas oryzihabitans]
MKWLAGMFAALLAGAPALGQVAQGGAGQPGILMITRGDAYSGSGCDIGLMIQGRLAGILMAGQSASFNLPPGEVAVSLTSSGPGACAAPMASAVSQSILLTPGEIRQYRIIATEAGYRLAPIPLY